MIKNKKVAALIFAKGYSTLHQKNLRLLSGEPLIFYSIEPAQKSKYIDTIIVLTDDKTVQRQAISLGAEVPFLLPCYLTSLSAGTNATLFYIADWLYENKLASLITYLQPSDLFKKTEWIDECLENVVDGAYSSCFLVNKAHKNFWMKNNNGFQRCLDCDPYINRQNKQNFVYREDTGMGAALDVQSIVETRSRVGLKPHLLEKEYVFFDIHDEIDLYLAERYLEYEKARNPNSK